MKITSLVLLCWIISCAGVQAQKQIRVKADTDITRAIPMADRYRYPQFMAGNVVYRNGVSGGGRLNYNRLLGEIQFIDTKGDTLGLADEQNVAHVMIGTTRFYVNPGKGCPEVISEHGPVKLARQTVFRSMRSEKKVAYGQSSGASSVATVQPYSNNSSMHRIESIGDQMVKEETTYFIIDQNERYYQLNKNTLYKVFPKHKKAIEAYLNEQSVQFSEEADLQKLIQFCSGLSLGPRMNSGAINKQEAPFPKARSYCISTQLAIHCPQIHSGACRMNKLILRPLSPKYLFA